MLKARMLWIDLLSVAGPFLCMKFFWNTANSTTLNRVDWLIWCVIGFRFVFQTICQNLLWIYLWRRWKMWSVRSCRNAVDYFGLHFNLGINFAHFTDGGRSSYHGVHHESRHHRGHGRAGAIWRSLRSGWNAGQVSAVAGSVCVCFFVAKLFKMSLHRVAQEKTPVHYLLFKKKNRENVDSCVSNVWVVVLEWMWRHYYQCVRSPPCGECVT